MVWNQPASGNKLGKRENSSNIHDVLNFSSSKPTIKATLLQHQTVTAEYPMEKKRLMSFIPY